MIFQTGSFQKIFKSEVEEALKRYSPQGILTDHDIETLPLPVQKYIKYTGAVGKEKLHNFRAVFKGGIKLKPDSDFLDFASIQYNFFDQLMRAFYIQSKLYGVPFDGLHLYKGESATMQIRVASIFQVADARGDEMNKGETVTMLNDMCFLALASLISKNLEWETIDLLL